MRSRRDLPWHDAGDHGAVALDRPLAELIIPERFRADHAAGIERFLASGTGPLVPFGTGFVRLLDVFTR